MARSSVGYNLYGLHIKPYLRNFVVYADHDSAAGGSLPSGSSSNSIKGWILGMVSLVLPFFTNKWGPLWVLKNRIENAVETVEEIVETVEKVAEEVDKIAENISDDLPEGKIKDLVELVENVAEKTAKSADSLDDLIDKVYLANVQEAEDQMESFVESLDEEAKKSSKEAKDYK
ncbi:hypothetical protein BUALT_Bualt08G0123100 [Buddleja alternifolia]|uniref:Uncharacterized protein n=1 Tax=Buddleja alternifolia TaxID=168488 RepID=A0AAV6XGW5_9LAMI|nr:hypothetical protein BUALT_Bualt08G0123100 [Buddleja alternifolia]